LPSRFAALLGGFYAGARWSPRTRFRNNTRSSPALGAIETNFVGDVESDRLVYARHFRDAADAGSYSSFMDPRSYAQMRERQGRPLRSWHFD
jgi:hypothetical protein